MNLKEALESAWDSLEPDGSRLVLVRADVLETLIAAGEERRGGASKGEPERYTPTWQMS